MVSKGRLGGFKCIVSALLLVGAVHSSDAFANPYRTTITGNVKDLSALAVTLSDGQERRSSSISKSNKNALQFSTNINGLGRFKIILNEVRYKSWSAKIESASGNQDRDLKDVIVVSGYAISQNKKVPVGGSIYSEDGRPVLHLVLNAHRGKGRTAYLKALITSGSSLKDVKISSVPATRLKALPCGNTDIAMVDAHDDDHSLATSKELSSPQAAGTVRVATMGTEFDHEFYAAYGADSNAQIATLVAAASAIYEQQLGIRFQITSQHGFSSASGSPFTSSNAGTLLSAFRTYSTQNNQLGDADLYHMFSGKDFEGTTIGLAWVGVTCSVQDYSFGVTQRFHPSADSSIVAHELGHNFGSGHDSTDSNSLMAPFVNVPGSTYFSQASLNEINSHLNESPNCFDTEAAGPTPVPTSTPVPPSSVPSDPTDPTDPEDPTDPSDPSDPESVPDISLTSSISRAGLLSIRVAVTELQDGCRVRLLGSAGRNRSATVLYSFVPTGLSTMIRLAGLRDPITRSSILTFSAEYVCDEGTSASEPVRVNLNTVRAKTRQVISQVLSAIRTAFQELARENRSK